MSLVVIFIVTIAVFLAMRILPGDPIYMIFSPNEVQQFTEEELQNIRHEAGLDRPLTVQYVDWISGALHGDLGVSIIHKTSVSKEVAKRLPITVYLGMLAFILGNVVGIPMGIISAVKRGTWLDTVVTTIANLGVTVPIFWMGVMLIYMFAIKLDVLPVMGYTSPFTDLWMSTRQLIMPVLCLSVFPVAGTARQTRSSMLEVLNQDYIRTAWSKGLEVLSPLSHWPVWGWVPSLAARC